MYYVSVGVKLYQKENFNKHTGRLIMTAITDLLQVIGFSLLFIGVFQLFAAKGFLNKEHPFAKGYLRIGVILTPIGAIILVLGIILSYI
jgi:energy-converting hydrogenase Eha subunit C